MRRSDLKDKQIKRILFYWNALFNDHQLQMEAVLQFMSEIFALSENYLWRDIINGYEMKDVEHADLKHTDLDEKMITGFVDKINRKAKKDRKEQLNLFTN